MKKLFALVLTVLMCLSLCACGEKGGEEPAPEGGRNTVSKIAVILPGSDRKSVG